MIHDRRGQFLCKYTLNFVISTSLTPLLLYPKTLGKWCLQFKYHSLLSQFPTIYHGFWHQHKVVESEHEVARNFTWAVLVMKDDNLWHSGGVTRWNSQFWIHTWTFLAIIYVASQLFLCLFWISLWLRIDVYNTLASKTCVKLLNLQKFRFQCPTLPFGFANTFMVSLHALCTPNLPIPLYCHE
jgi:hypothetical protein